MKFSANFRQGSVIMKDYKCPVCDADINLDGDEKPGDAVYCSYCSSTIKIYAKRGSDEFKLVDDN